MSKAPLPWERARSWWDRNGDGQPFEVLLAGYVRSGFVYSGDDAFILAMPQGDTWFVHLAAGDIGRFTQLAPFPLPRVAWQRRGGGAVRRYPWDRYVRHAVPNPKP